MSAFDKELQSHHTIDTEIRKENSKATKTKKTFFCQKCFLSRKNRGQKCWAFKSKVSGLLDNYHTAAPLQVFRLIKAVFKMI